MIQKRIVSDFKQQRSPESPDGGWLPSVLLVMIVCVAVLGVLSGSSPALMIAVSTLALASWEIAEQVAQRWENHKFHPDHLIKWVPRKLLLTSVGMGLLIAEVGLQIQLTVPFGVVIFAVLLILFGFTRFYRVMNK